MAKQRLFVKNPNYSYADTFDEIMSAHFGEDFKTEWSLFAGSFGGYATVRANGKPLTQTHKKIGRLVSNAMSAGADEYLSKP